MGNCHIRPSVVKCSNFGNFSNFLKNSRFGVRAHSNPLFRHNFRDCTFSRQILRRGRRPGEIDHFTASNCRSPYAHFLRRGAFFRTAHSIWVSVLPKIHLLSRGAILLTRVSAAPGKWVSLHAKTHLLGKGAILRTHVSESNLIYGFSLKRQPVCLARTRCRNWANFN